jgi:tetratricopeptide (TPR) repeat protein
MPGGVDWLPGLVVLAAGLLGGYVLVRRLRAAPAAAVAPATLERRDLEARRDALVDQLRDLPETASLADERRRLEHEAARVLRDLDRLLAAPGRAGRAETPAAAAADRPAAAPQAGLRGFLWGAGSAAALALLLFFVSRSTAPREEGGSLTGEVPGGTGAPADADGALAQLEAAVQRNPDDVEARIALARGALARQDLMTVFQQTKAVLDKQPDHAQALSYQALVRLAMNQPDLAEQMLKRALATDPDLLEGYVHMSLVHLRQGRREDARRDIEEAVRRSPEHAERLRSLWTQMSAQAEAEPAPGAPAGEDPHAGLGESEPAAVGTQGIAGAIELAPGLTPAPGAIVFVSVRPAGTAGGPPVAAKRMAATSFPLAFAVSSADSMMGGSLPEKLRVDVRVDGDGDPVTRDPADPTASADGVARGTTGLRLILRKGP